MKTKKNSTPKTSAVAELRQSAEAQLNARRKKTPPASGSEADTLRLFHELQVHQIELEMQNEELLRSRAEAEGAYGKYTDLYDFAPVGYFTLTREGKIHEVNLAGANLLSMERVNLINRRLGVFVAVESRAAFNTFFARLLSGAGQEICELAFQKNESDLIWVLAEATCFEGGPESRIVMVNITQSKQIEEQLLLQSAALDAAANAIVITDHAGTIKWINQAFTSLTGYTSAEAVGRNPRELLKSDKQAAAFYKSLWDTIVAGKVWRGELINRRKDGSTYIEEQTITPLRNGFGKVTHFIAVKQDITERKQAEAELRSLSIHDSLTGLYNRAFFMEAMARLERGRDFPVSIVMADVDGLKQVNDTHGHAAGDALIKRVAQVLTKAFRAEDVVARVGGDEFAILLPATTAIAAEVSLQRVHQVIDEHNASGTDRLIHISLGMSTAVKAGLLATALKEADANMYREKRKYNEG